MWAWSIPINGSTCPFPLRSFSFLSPKKFSNLRHLNSRNFFTDAGYPDSFYGVPPTVIQRFNWHAAHLGLHEFLITTDLRYGHRSILSFEPKRQRSIVPNQAYLSPLVIQDICTFLDAILAMDICCNNWQKCAAGFRCSCNCDSDGFTLVKENVMKLVTLRSVLLYSTLLSSSAVCYSAIPSGSL